MIRCIFTILTVLLISQCVYPQKPKRPYKEYDGARFEGQIEMPYSGSDFKLISFMGYKEKASDDKNTILKIRFYFPYSASDSLFITVSEIVKTNKFYSMQPIKKHWQPNMWQEFNDWPIKDVLLPLDLSIDEIGILGRLNNPEEGNGTIMPMHLYYSNFPDSVTDYVIYFKTQKDLKKLHYEVRDLNSDKVIESRDINNIYGKLIYSINIGLSGYPVGLYRLIFKKELKDEPGMRPCREYKFYYNPVLN